MFEAPECTLVVTPSTNPSCYASKAITVISIVNEQNSDTLISEMLLIETGIEYTPFLFTITQIIRLSSQYND